MSMPDMSGAEMIAAERLRQIEVKGWTPSVWYVCHFTATAPSTTAQHTAGEMLAAAKSYVEEALNLNWDHDFEYELPSYDFPWDLGYWRPSVDPVRNLVKAGALIAAEIDRLQRAGS